MPTVPEHIDAMTCQEIELLLSVYIDDELTVEEQTQVEDHLSACAACRALVAEFADMRHQLMALDRYDAPPDFRQRVTQRLDAKPRHWLLRWPGRFPRLAPALSMLTLLCVGALFLLFQAPSPQDEQHAAEINIYAEDVLFGDQESTEWEDAWTLENDCIADDLLESFDELDNESSWLPIHGQFSA